MTRRSAAARSKTVLVTVGTTSFKALTDVCLHDDAFLKLLHRHGVTSLIVQHGDASTTPSHSNLSLDIKTYAYVDDLQALIQEADLVIAHAGAGTTLEVLKSGKKLVTVINESLMDNHQSELAEEMASKGHALLATPSYMTTFLIDLAYLDAYN